MAVRGAAQSHPAGSGLYRIDGPGSNWTNLYNSGATSVSALAVSAQHPQLAFAVSPQGLLRTADGGATWTVALPPVSPPFTPSVTSVAIDPTNDALVYAMGSPTFYTSTDSGLTWSYGAVFGVPNPDHRIWVDARQPQVLFSVSSGNLIRNSNRGTAAWQSIPTSTGPLSMAFDPFTTGTIYAATQKNLQVSTDDGLTWSSLGQPNTAYTPQYILADPLHQGTLYASSYGGVFRSVDSGATWTQVGGDTNAGPMAADAASRAIYFWINGFATALALESDGTAIVAGGSTLYHMYWGGLSLVGTANVAGTVYALAADGADNIYAAGGSGPELFSGTQGAFQTAPVTLPVYSGGVGNGGLGDAFLAKFDSQLRPLSATLLGGEAPDQAQAVALAANGNVYLGGSTSSRAFPTRGATQSSFSASTSFFAGLTPDLSALQFSTYAGDTRTFSILSLAPMPDGGAVVAGSTLGPIFQSYFSGFDPAVPNASQALVARYTVTAQGVLRVDSVLNAASHLGVALSAGETFLVSGAGFGTDVALLLNGAPLSLIAKSATTLIAAVPLDFASPAAATITVQSGGARSSILAPFSSAAPGIFSIDGSGLGQGYVLNADGTLNSPANPALEGSKITVFATGVGPMTFAGPYAVTGSPVEVLVDGFLAQGIAAVLGPAASLPGDVYQISVYVPQPSISAASNSYFTNFHLPAQSAVTLMMNPLQNGAQSQAGSGFRLPIKRYRARGWHADCTTDAMRRLFTVVGAVVLVAAVPLSAAKRPPKKSARPVDESVLRVQVLLDRAHFSPGQIDGSVGNVTKLMLTAFQTQHSLPVTGVADDATKQALEQQSVPTVVAYTIVYDDVRGPFNPLPSDIMAQAKLPALNYQSAWDGLGEKFHCSPSLLHRLNPKQISLKPGDQISVPNVHHDVPQGAASIAVSKSARTVAVLDASGKPIATYPATIGSEHDPLPIGSWKITKVEWNPTFYFNPELFWNASPKDAKATIKPGPRNPVGVVWIGLDKEHYGLHGTPDPATIGHTTSHGCVRLTNWDAAEIAQMGTPGMQVAFQE